jgi:choline kinase
MRFIVLAAGTGSRLRPLTNDTPKCLITVAGQSILERLLEQAHSTRRFSEAVVITGYFAEQVADFSHRWSIAGSLPVRLVHNERFAETQNSFSLYLARHLLEEGFVLADGDLVLDPHIIARVAASDRSCLAVDSSRALDAEAVKCELDDQRLVVGLSKDIPAHRGAAESIGLSRLDAEDAEAMTRHLTALVQHEEFDEYYERAYQDMLADGWRPGLIDVAGLGWEEVDDHRDLEHARALALGACVHPSTKCCRCGCE